MTPAEKLIAIVERAKPGCPDDFDRVWGHLAPMHVLTLRAERAEWQQARDLLDRLLREDAKSRADAERKALMAMADAGVVVLFPMEPGASR